MWRMRFSISREFVRWQISPSLACKYKNDILQKSAQNLSEKDWFFFILITRTDIYFCKPPPSPQSVWPALWSSIGQVHSIFHWLFYGLYIKSLWTSLKLNFSQFDLQNVMRTRKKQCHHHHHHSSHEDLRFCRWCHNFTSSSFCTCIFLPRLNLCWVELCQPSFFLVGVNNNNRK